MVMCLVSKKACLYAGADWLIFQSESGERSIHPCLETPPRDIVSSRGTYDLGTYGGLVLQPRGVFQVDNDI